MESGKGLQSWTPSIYKQPCLYVTPSSEQNWINSNRTLHSGGGSVKCPM